MQNYPKNTWNDHKVTKSNHKEWKIKHSHREMILTIYKMTTKFTKGLDRDTKIPHGHIRWLQKRCITQPRQMKWSIRETTWAQRYRITAKRGDGPKKKRTKRTKNVKKRYIRTQNYHRKMANYQKEIIHTQWWQSIISRSVAKWQ